MIRFLARNGMLNHRYARLLWRYLWRRLLTRAGRRWRTDGFVFFGRRLELETGRLEELELSRDLVVISVIGENMRGTPGIAGRIFSALGAAGVNVLVIAQGSSERNISFVVAGGQHVAAIRTIHDAFLGDHR